MIPVKLLKLKDENWVIYSQINLDLYPLCNDQLQSHRAQLHFETGNGSIDSKISFNSEISSDLPILKEPFVNFLYVTFESICNLDKETSSISIGTSVPFRSEVTKSFYSFM